MIVSVPDSRRSIREGDSAIQPFAAPLQCVCFDLDGTLSYYPLSTEDVLTRALTQCDLALDLFGNLSSAADRYNEFWLSLERSVEPTDVLRGEIMRRMIEASGISDPTLAPQLAQAYGEIRRQSGVLAFPGVDRLLADLRPRYQLGLVTNGPSDMQREKILAIGLDGYFDVTIVAGDHGIYKPDPRIFEQLLDQLQVAAQDALFVGDSYEADIVGAAQVGMYTAWIRAEPSTPPGDLRPTITCPETIALREVLL